MRRIGHMAAAVALGLVCLAPVTPIRDGRLTTDLDANGKRILNLDTSNLLIGGGGGGSLPPLSGNAGKILTVTPDGLSIFWGPANTFSGLFTDLNFAGGNLNTLLGTPTVRGINKEVWISVRIDSVAGTGTADDPFNGNTSTLFDAAINLIRTTYLNAPVTVHLGAGTFLTKGGNGNTNVLPVSGGAVYPSNITIKGAGRYQTTVKLEGEPAGWDSGPGKWAVLANEITSTAGGVIVEDLTVDGNWQNLATGGVLHSKGTNKGVHGTFLFGSNNTVRNCRFINIYGDQVSNQEAWAALFHSNSGATIIATANNAVESCLFESPRGNYQNGIGFIGGDNTHQMTNSRGRNNVGIGLWPSGLYNCGFIDGFTSVGDFTDGCPAFFNDTGGVKNLQIKDGYFRHVPGAAVSGFSTQDVSQGWIHDNWHITNCHIEIQNDTNVPTWGVALSSDGTFSNSSVENCTILKNINGVYGDLNLYAGHILGGSNYTFVRNTTDMSFVNYDNAGFFDKNRTPAGGTVSGAPDTPSRFTSILDTNGNTEIAFSAVGGSVNYLGISNASTGNTPEILSLGSDSIIDLKLTPKGGGDVTLPGTAALVWSGRGKIELGSANQFEFKDTTTARILTIKPDSVIIGSSTASVARLLLPAGTSASSSAPLKITPGVVMTTPESGAIESDGTHLYWTSSSAGRYPLEDRVDISDGSGSPEGALAKPVGSLYVRTSPPSIGTTLYVKTSGTGNTGWTADPLAIGNAPPGGTATQVLTKIDATDYNYSWQDQIGGGGGGSGTVTSIGVATANGISATPSAITSSGDFTFNLGAITPTTVNGLTITTTTGTFSLTSGKTLTVSNTLTLAGTDSSTLNIGAGGTLGSNAFTSTAYVPQTTTVNTHPLSGNLTLTPTDLGATTVGGNIFSLTNPSVLSFLRINADGTVTARSLANFKTDLAISALTDISNLAPSATTDTTNASNITSGSLSPNQIADVSLPLSKLNYIQSSVAETSTISISVGTRLQTVFTGTSAPYTISFLGTMLAGMSPTVLSVTVTNGPYTITIPDSYFVGETGSVIHGTSKVIHNGPHEISWQKKPDGNIWIVDSIPSSMSASSRLLGSSATGAGLPTSEITLGTNLSMSGSTLNASLGSVPTTPNLLKGDNAGAIADSGVDPGNVPLLDGTNPFTNTNSITVSTNAKAFPLLVKNVSNGTGAVDAISLWNDQNLGTRSLDIGYTSSTYTGQVLSGGPTGEVGYMATTGAKPLLIGANNAPRIIVGDGTAINGIVIGQTAGTNPGTNNLRVDGGTVFGGVGVDLSLNANASTTNNVRLIPGSSGNVSFDTARVVKWNNNTGIKSNNGVLEGRTAADDGYIQSKWGFRDTGTNTVVPGLTVNRGTSGTAALGFGAAIAFTADSATSTDQDIGQIRAAWKTATTASRTSFVGVQSVGKAQTLTDRQIIGTAINVATNNVALPLFDVVLPTLKGCAGTVTYRVFWADATRAQCRSGIARYSGVNVGGTYTREVAVVGEGVSASTGTLTATPTWTTGVNLLRFNITPNSSLSSPVSYYVEYTIQNLSESTITVL